MVFCCLKLLVSIEYWIMDIKNKQKQVIAVVAIIILVVVFLVIKNKASLNNIQDNKNTNEEVINPVTETRDTTEVKNTFNKTQFDKIMTLAADAYNNKNYQESLDYYKKALNLKELDVVYGKMYLVYLDIKDYKNASLVLDKAITLNPNYNQYWFWKIESGLTYNKKSFSELNKIYKEAYGKVEITAKINLVTFFAGIAEQMGQKERAIEVWKDAIRINPNKTPIYQAEIDRLSQ